MSTDSNYESIAPGIFRFEYYYFLKEQTLPSGTQEPAILSSTPWDTRMNHTAVNGMSDVAAIGVAIAVVDPASRNLVSNAQLTTLAGQMNDFAATMQPANSRRNGLRLSRRAVCLMLLPRPFAFMGACSIYLQAFSDVL